MSILVTGAAGFIGFHLMQRLVFLNLPVVGIDLFTPFYNPLLKRERASLLGSSCKEQSIAAFVMENDPLDFTTIYHLAGQPGVRSTNPFDHIDRNIYDLILLLEWAKKNPALSIFFASSSSVYGQAEGNAPFEETMRCDRPLSVYAASKRSAEMLLHTYTFRKAYCFRFFNVYGTYGRPDNLYWIAAQKMMSGEPITLFHPEMSRDMTHVDDIVEGLLLAQDSPLLGYHIFNLCHGKSEKMVEMIALLENVLGKKAEICVKAPLGKQEGLYTLGSYEKSKALLGYNPKVEFHHGMTLFGEWIASRSLCEQGLGRG